VGQNHALVGVGSHKLGFLIKPRPKHVAVGKVNIHTHTNITSFLAWTRNSAPCKHLPCCGGDDLGCKCVGSKHVVKDGQQGSPPTNARTQPRHLCNKPTPKSHTLKLCVATLQVSLISTSKKVFHWLTMPRLRSGANVLSVALSKTPWHHPLTITSCIPHVIFVVATTSRDGGHPVLRWPLHRTRFKMSM
jgi:hypothetical protein